jgi:hypothetical protein
VAAADPVGMLASTSPGCTPPSSAKPVGLGPVDGIVQRRVTRFPATDEATSLVGASGSAGAWDTVNR